MAELPLEGIRVIDVTLVWAGPYGTMFLADMGAEVIRVEPIRFFPTSTRGIEARPPKEVVAKMTPSAVYFPERDPGPRPWNRHAWFNGHSRNKYSMTCDLATSHGKDIFRRLVEVSDVVAENNAVGSMARLGLSYDVLSQWNPRLIMVSSTGAGQTGAWSRYTGMGMQWEALYGHQSFSGYADMDPSGSPGGAASDGAAGPGMVLAVLMALHYRNKTGKGQYIDLSQGENLLPHWGEIFMDYTMNGRSQGPLGNRDHSIVQGAYRSQGHDEWVAISIHNDEEWRALCRAIGRAELAGDPRFADVASRFQHHDEVDQILQAWTSQRTAYETFRLLQAAGVPAGPYIHETDVPDDPQVKERDFMCPITHPETGPVIDGKATPGTHLYPTLPFKLSKAPFRPWKGHCMLGEDNEYVYKQILKVSDEEYDQLVAEGQIGLDYPPNVR